MLLDQIEASVDAKAIYNNDSNSESYKKQKPIPNPPPSSSLQPKQQCGVARSSRKKDKYESNEATVKIAKADFMLIAAKEPKHSTSFNDESTDSDFGFTDNIVNTSTPIERNKHQSYFTNNRVLRETYNKQEASNSSLYFNTRSRRRNIANKEKSESPKPTFNLRKKL